MANRKILDPSFKRISMILSIQSHVREKIIKLANESQMSSSQYVEELFIKHLQEKGI